MFTKFLCTAAIIASATMAQAVTFKSTAGAPDPGVGKNNVIIDNFNSMATPAGVTLTGGYGYRTGSTMGYNGAAAPAGDTTQYLYVSSSLTPNNATLGFANQSRVSFYWGSIDKYNTVDILGANGAILRSVSGDQFMPANGNQGSGATNRRVTFAAGKGETITGLKFTSGGVAFEVDDLAGRAGVGTGSTVPEPSSWAMLLAGFGLVGFASRRRNRGAASVAA